MFPIRDENPTLRPPIATYVLIGMNALVWAVVQGFGNTEALAQSLCLYGLIPGDLLSTVPSGTQFSVGGGWVCQVDGNGRASSLLSSMFMHGGWFHILGNMLFLWVFGDNVEDAMGHLKFLLFYLLCGAAGAIAHTLAMPDSGRPLIGASGAVAGVIAAYLILHPRVRVWVLALRVFPIQINAAFALGLWIAIQVAMVLTPQIGPVAWWAHIGGLIAGAVLVVVLKKAGVPLFDRGLAR
jgi:membrane associated rhomboid family serine protease